MAPGVEAYIVTDLRQGGIGILQKIGSSFYPEFQNVILDFFSGILTEDPGQMPLADPNRFCNVLHVDLVVVIL